MTKEDYFEYSETFKKKYNFDPIDYNFWEGSKSVNIEAAYKIFDTWSHLTESHKCRFAEICRLFRTFCELFNNYYEDLFLFALTHHNVYLWTCFSDSISLFYFASQKDDIIGYKERFFAKHLIDNQFYNRLLSVDIPSELNIFALKKEDILEQYELYLFREYKLVPGIDPLLLVDCLKKTTTSTHTCDECKKRDIEEYYQFEYRKNYLRKSPIDEGRMIFKRFVFWREEMEGVAIADEIKESRLREEEERKKAALEAQRIERERQSDYNYINRHNRDALITVSSSSHCQYQGITLKPITDFVAEFFPKFNKEARAKEISIRTGRDISSILQEWDIAIAEGTRLHRNIDKFYHNKQGDNSRSDFNLFLDFTRDHKLTPYRSEWTIFDEGSELVGTVDFLDYSNGVFTLYDWKRSKNLIDEDGIIKHNKYEHRMGYYPISDLEDLPFWHYALQQNVYRYILKKCYDIEVKRMKLVVLHPSLKHYEIIDVPNMEPEITKLIQTRL